MPIRFLAFNNVEQKLPLNLYTIGIQEQGHINRQEGFPASQVFLVRQGQGILRVFEQRDRIVGINEVIMIKMGVPHEYFPISAAPWELSFVSFNGFHAASLWELFEFNKADVLKLRSLDRLWVLHNDLWSIAEQREEQTPWLASDKIYAFLLELRRQAIEAALNYERIVFEHPSEATISKAVKFLNDHYAEPILFSDVAYSLGYTPQHMNRLFRKLHGMTPQQYLQDIRLQRAEYLLGTYSQLSVKEVAAQVGLETGYFIRSFRRNFGTTPGKFKLQEKH